MSAQASLPVHPTQLYESLVGGLLLLLTWQLRRASRFRGEVFLAFTFGYGYLRFLLEIVRDDSERGSFGPAFREHVLVPSLLVLLAAAFAYGPLRSVARVAVRRAATAFAFVVPVLAYWLLRCTERGSALDVAVDLAGHRARGIARVASARAVRTARRGSASPSELYLIAPRLRASDAHDHSSIVEIDDGVSRGGAPRCILV